jgi:hypothetical protein
MAGIRIEAKLWPSVWANLGDQDGEPLFITVGDGESDPAVGLLTLGLVQEWGGTDCLRGHGGVPLRGPSHPPSGVLPTGSL